MDKKTIILVVILGALILGFWPIMEFLGIYEAPPDQPQQTQMSDSTEVTTPPPLDATTPDPVVTQPETAPIEPEFSMDTVRVDSLTVITDNYEVVLSSLGGGPVSLLLKDYTYRDDSPIQMLPNATAATPTIEFAGGTFSTSSLVFASNLAPGTYNVGSEPLVVTYTYQGPNGGALSKTFTFYKDHHDYSLAVSLDQPDAFGVDRSYELNWNTPLGPTEPDINMDYESMEVAAMISGSRETLNDFDGDKLNQVESGSVSWVGVRSKYFAAVMIAENREGETAHGWGTETSVVTGENDYDKRDLTAGIGMQFARISPIADSFTVFVGPLDYYLMDSYNNGLEDMLGIGTTPVIGWLIQPFAIGIMWLLPKMYDVIPNYGLVIIIFAFLIKLVTLPLSLKSFKSMQAMKIVQPEVEKLKEKHKKDPQKLNQEMMALYKKHGVNPLSGCLPMLPQLPLFFALFSVFRSTILLRDAPFFWFIDDLSRGATGFSDPYIILVLLMIGAQFVSQKLTMASTQQNKMFIYLMPFLMGFIFYKFAAGLVLYWTAFSIMAMLDYLIFKRGKQNEGGQVVTT